MESSAACWAKYGEVLAREYSDVRYMQWHRLTVDTYAVQHPGQPSLQSIQSVAVHLIALGAILELGTPHSDVTGLIRRCVEAGGFEWLEPPDSRGALTVLHPHAAASAKEHEVRVREWATSAWRAWSAHHSRVLAWCKQHLP